jgi:bacillithiol biosynthesis cysteine-adding enzyme BshC
LTTAPALRSSQAVPTRASGFALDFLRGDPRATRFLARHPSRLEDFDERARTVEPREPARAVWERARDSAQGWGAPPAAIEGARQLAEGRALCVVTGQQPGLFLGPLYATYKAATAVRLAAFLAERWKRPVVPVFWVAGDDTDFAEIAVAYLPTSEHGIEKRALSGGTLPAGGMVGALSPVETRDALAAFRASWSTTPAGAGLVHALDRSVSIARDHGEIAAVLLSRWLGAQGLVVIDGRWEELRRGAREIFTRFAERRASVEDAVTAAGRALEAAGYAAPLSEVQAQGGLFEIRDVRRLPFDGNDAALAARARETPETLSPSVILRPIVQDHVLPNVATVAGPSEIAYHAQIAPVYERLGAAPPVLVPRFEATLVPAGVAELASRRGIAADELVRDFDGAMRRSAWRTVPADLGEGIQGLERALEESGSRVGEAAHAFEPKLEGALGETRRRIAEALARFREKVENAARDAERKRDPRIRHYREFLAPFGQPQERVLSSLALELEGGPKAIERLFGLVDRHLESSRAKDPSHWLVELESLGGADGA